MLWRKHNQDMDESSFAKELAKYRVVRRADYRKGPNQSAATTSAVKPPTKKPSSSASTTKTTTTTTATRGFWELLLDFAKEKGLSNDDAAKLVNAAKEIHLENKKI
ncbi:hypothetical protein BASA81_012365 [Batrachochytrium salamandrivorans]|nr:hypothetical protein BASA81_012365 [Batrachochytrium salamandrivorans]